MIFSVGIKSAAFSYFIAKIDFLLLGNKALFVLAEQ